MVLIPAKGFDHTRTVSGPPTEILDQIPTPIWRAGPDFLCDYVNRAWLSFTGRTLDQELGRGWLEDIHPEDRDRTLAVVFARSDGSQPGSRNPPHGDVSRRSCDPHARAHVRRLTRLLGVRAGRYPAGSRANDGHESSLFRSSPRSEEARRPSPA